MNVTSCEQLGNLCVLQLYDKKTAACLAYQNLAKSRPVISSVLYDRYVSV